VIAAAQLGERPFVIGHSFSGFMRMKVASIWRYAGRCLTPERAIRSWGGFVNI
jgi:hypothetical protein